jgi:hypothetical protein
VEDKDSLFSFGFPAFSSDTTFALGFEEHLWE